MIHDVIRVFISFSHLYTVLLSRYIPEFLFHEKKQTEIPQSKLIGIWLLMGSWNQQSVSCTHLSGFCVARNHGIGCTVKLQSKPQKSF